MSHDSRERQAAHDLGHREWVAGACFEEGPRALRQQSARAQHAGRHPLHAHLLERAETDVGGATRRSLELSIRPVGHYEGQRDLSELQPRSELLDQSRSDRPRPMGILEKGHDSGPAQTSEGAQ